jgi:hypothetical protein
MLHTRNNPGFFKNTVVERAVADELGLKEHRPLRHIDDLLGRVMGREQDNRQSIARVKDLIPRAFAIIIKDWLAR